jgi:hypothetical protein
MQFNVDLSAGKVTGEFTVAEFLTIVDLMNAREATPARPPAFELPVESDSKRGTFYLVRIWLDPQGGQHGSCECPHHQHRGAWCKHLRAAEIVRNRQLVAML